MINIYIKDKLFFVSLIPSINTMNNDSPFEDVTDDHIGVHWRKFLYVVAPKPLLNHFNKSFGLTHLSFVQKRVIVDSFAPALDVSEQYTPKWPC